MKFSIITLLLFVSIFSIAQINDLTEIDITNSKIKFQVVYEYSFDSSIQLDESWFEDNGKPVQNATIKIVGMENIYTLNENGEIWVDKNDIQIGNVLIIEDEMGSQSQVNITSKILSDKIIPFSILAYID